MAANSKKFLQLVPFYPTALELHPKEDYFLMPADIMRDKGFEVEFVTLRNTAPTPEYKSSADNIAPEFEVVKGYPVKRFGSMLSLFGYMRKQKGAIVQVHLRPYPPSQFAPFFVPQRKALRAFTYLLGSNKIVEILTKLSVPRYDVVFCCTPYEIDIYRKAGVKEERIRHVPLSIDYECFSARPNDVKAVAEKFGYADSEFVVISIAQIRRHKRFDDVMRALKIVREKIPSAKFLAVGDDWLPRQGLPDIMAAAESIGVKDSVIWTGFQDMKTVRALLHGSTAFVHGADNEYQGLVSYEAAAAGVPLCLSNIGTHASVFGDYALYHEVTDHATLAKNLLRYYEDRALVKRNTSFLKEKMKDWDYGVIRKKMGDAYDEMVN
ncbi:glycosyltransferase family 4 protein [Candidatus Woesearchaeota archaeon]|nr:glycosyltransferase family 4 protein [Candidatus Woesearchaeota archaeon]